MGEQIYGENVEIGQKLPVFSRKTDLMHWNRWAAIYDEFLYYHMDDERAIENGQPSSIGQGRLRVSYAHTLLRNWIGDEGSILKLDVQISDFSLFWTDTNYFPLESPRISKPTNKYSIHI